MSEPTLEKKGKAKGGIVTGGKKTPLECGEGAQEQQPVPNPVTPPLHTIIMEIDDEGRLIRAVDWDGPIDYHPPPLPSPKRWDPWKNHWYLVFQEQPPAPRTCQLLNGKWW